MPSFVSPISRVIIIGKAVLPPHTSHLTCNTTNDNLTWCVGVVLCWGMVVKMVNLDLFSVPLPTSYWTRVQRNNLQCILMLSSLFPDYLWLEGMISNTTLEPISSLLHTFREFIVLSLGYSCTCNRKVHYSSIPSPLMCIIGSVEYSVVDVVLCMCSEQGWCADSLSVSPPYSLTLPCTHHTVARPLLAERY